MDIQFDPDQHRFFTLIEGQECYLSYRAVQPDLWNVHYSYVPPALRGRMIAVALVENLVVHARQNHIRLKPTCGFVVKCFERHSDWQDVLAR